MLKNPFLKFYSNQLVACLLWWDTVVIIFKPSGKNCSWDIGPMDGETGHHKYLKEISRNSPQRSKSKFHLKEKKMMSL